MDENLKPWPWDGVVYQIYPRSFYDANGDGIGDLKGITDKLDYLAGSADSLGVNGIWLSPFYKSPMVDFGYDVSDYYDVDPIFGNLDDFNNLLEKAHERELKVMVDLVVNHTSDQHPWFLESRSSVDNPYRDWYTWRPPTQQGSLPNNWRSVFGGPAWTYDPHTGEYYLHSFAAQQPDLNWDNPKVRETIKDVVRFWLDLGVDGFRMDAVNWISKDPQMRDDPPDPSYHQGDSSDYDALLHPYSCGGSQLFNYIREITDTLKDHQGTFIVTEAYPSGNQGASEYLKFYENIDPALSAPFNFEGIYLPWNARSFKSKIDEFQHLLKPDYLPIYTLGNHDKRRLATRIGRPAVRTAAMMLLTLPGMPFIYYGEEIGMVDVQVPQHLARDPYLNQDKGRDTVRTPMQWDNSPNAGFSRSPPWLPVSAHYAENNVQLQAEDQTSILNLYRSLIKLRKSSAALKFGNYQPVETAADIFGYERVYNDEKVAVALNFSPRTVSAQLPAGHLIMSSYLDTPERPIEAGPFDLRPYEGVIIAAG